MRRSGGFDRLARLVARRPVGILLAAYAFGTDWLVSWHGLNFVSRALIDEPAHMATALVVLGAICRFRGSPPDARFGWTMLACSVLIDVDHLPAEFGSNAFTHSTPRPYTHALWTVLVLILAWAIARHRAHRSGRPRPATSELVLAGAAWGLSAHFLRDIATAPMSLWWPLSDMPVQVPYWWYVLTLLLIIVLGSARLGRAPSRGGEAPHDSTTDRTREPKTPEFRIGL